MSLKSEITEHKYYAELTFRVERVMRENNLPLALGRSQSIGQPLLVLEEQLLLLRMRRAHVVLGAVGVETKEIDIEASTLGSEIVTPAE